MSGAMGRVAAGVLMAPPKPNTSDDEPGYPASFVGGNGWKRELTDELEKQRHAIEHSIERMLQQLLKNTADKTINEIQGVQQQVYRLETMVHSRMIEIEDLQQSVGRLEGVAQRPAGEVGPDDPAADPSPHHHMAVVPGHRPAIPPAAIMRARMGHHSGRTNQDAPESTESTPTNVAVTRRRSRRSNTMLSGNNYCEAPAKAAMHLLMRTEERLQEERLQGAHPREMRFLEDSAPVGRQASKGRMRRLSQSSGPRLPVDPSLQEIDEPSGFFQDRGRSRPSGSRGNATSSVSSEDWSRRRPSKVSVHSNASIPEEPSPTRAAQTNSAQHRAPVSSIAGASSLEGGQGPLSLTIPTEASPGGSRLHPRRMGSLEGSISPGSTSTADRLDRRRHLTGYRSFGFQPDNDHRNLPALPPISFRFRGPTRRSRDSVGSSASARDSRHVLALQGAQGGFRSQQAGEGLTMWFATTWSSKPLREPVQRISLIMLTLNAIYIGIQVEISMQCARDGKDPPDWIWWGDLIFAIAFIVEVGVRVMIEWDEFFSGPKRRWNTFDACLLLQALFEVLYSFIDLTAVSAFTALKALRASRIIRTVRFVRELRMMFASIICSFSSLMWAVVVLVLVLYIFTIGIMQVVGSYIRNRSTELEGSDLLKFWGSMPGSMESLFMAITGGVDWHEVLDPLESISGFFVPVFAIYIVFIVLGVMNVLTAIFVGGAHHIAEIDRNLAIQHNTLLDNATMEEVKAKLYEAVEDETGKLPRMALENELEDVEMMKLLRMLEMERSELLGLFELLDIDEQGAVGIEELIFGMMRLKSTQKAVDVATVMYENKRMFMRLAEWMRNIDTRIELATVDMAVREPPPKHPRRHHRPEEQMEEPTGVSPSLSV